MACRIAEVSGKRVQDKTARADARRARGTMARDDQTHGSRKPVVIKKYANRRLYNTATSSYVTLDHLCQMVKDDVDFVVYDAKTGEDITRSVLTQIIVEEESKGTNLLPINFLRQLISFYGHSMQGVVPRYLEHMMGAFAQNQDRLRQQMQETMSGMFPFGSNLEEMGRQNAALMESAMKMFTPFAPGGETPSQPQNAEEAGASQGQAQQSAAAHQAAAQQAAAEQATEALVQLQAQVNQLQQQLNALSSEKTEGSSEKTEGQDDAQPGGAPAEAARPQDQSSQSS
jgi:polyhydroxyalkanoate synthesis repressor PhaR